MPKLSSNHVGVAGEYLVAAQLSLRGWLATVTLKNAPGVDVLAQHPDDGTLVSIQSKTMTASKHFRLRQSDEEPLAGANRGHDWFALVHLRSFSPEPLVVDYYVVPRLLASTLVYCGDKHWRSEPGRKGQKRNEHPMRAILPSAVAAYKDAWELLRRPALEAPVTLPLWVANMLRDHGDRRADRELYDRLELLDADTPTSPA